MPSAPGRCFPDEYAKLRADPKLLRNAFDESLRWDSPSRMAGRIATCDVADRRLGRPRGHPLRADVRRRQPRSALLGRDRKATGIERDTKHSLGWGYGVHGCVGRVLAQTEAQALLGALVREVESFEIAGEYEPWMTTVGHGPIRQPVQAQVCLSYHASRQSCPSPASTPSAMRGMIGPPRQNFAAPVDDHDLPMPLDYFVWAIHREGKTPVIVDTGFGEAAAAARGRIITRPVVGRAARCRDRSPARSRT